MGMMVQRGKRHGSIILAFLLISFSAFSQKKDSTRKIQKIWILKFSDAGLNTLYDVIDKSNAAYADEIKPLLLNIDQQINNQQTDTAVKSKVISDTTKKKK